MCNNRACGNICHREISLGSNAWLSKESNIVVFWHSSIAALTRSLEKEADYVLYFSVSPLLVTYTYGRVW